MGLLVDIDGTIRGLMYPFIIDHIPLSGINIPLNEKQFAKTRVMIAPESAYRCI